MDVDEFMRGEPPESNRSPLTEHLTSIRRLRAEGYSLRQVCRWLGKNGVEATVAGLSIFLKRAESKAKKQSRIRSGNGDLDAAAITIQESGTGCTGDRDYDTRS